MQRTRIGLLHTLSAPALDRVLVYFGYPRAHEDDAERAVQAGLELIAAVTALVSPVSLQNTATLFVAAIVLFGVMAAVIFAAINGGAALCDRLHHEPRVIQALGRTELASFFCDDRLRSTDPPSDVGLDAVDNGDAILNRLFDTIFSSDSPWTSKTSIGPPGSASSKTPIASRPVYHASVSRLVRFFLKIGPCAC